MKKHLRIFAAAVLCLGFVSVRAQLGPTPGGPSFSGPMSKLFGNNQTFSAGLEIQSTDSSSNTISIPGKINFDNGNSRFDINMSNMQGRQIPPDAAAQLKSMGLDQMVIVARPDKKIAYLIYPGVQSYVATEMADGEPAATNDDYKVETTELGKETVDGHPCVEKKVVITDKSGDKHAFTVWNATDLKGFPVKIEIAKGDVNTTMQFNNVSLAKPAASLFETPSDYTKYDNVPAMMQQQVIKRMGNSGFPGGMSPPPGK